MPKRNADDRFNSDRCYGDRFQPYRFCLHAPYVQYKNIYSRASELVYTWFNVYKFLESYDQFFTAYVNGKTPYYTD
jgi:hypothetical protein